MNEKELKFLFDLDCKVGIYVPSTNNVNEADNNNLQDYFVMKILKDFSRMFGGATSTDALGGWLSHNDGLVVERVKIVYAYCTKESFVININEIIALCNEIKEKMNQEAVTLEFNNQVKFI